MKKLISLALAGITAASLLASCAPAADRLDDAITLASSDAAEHAQWLDNRLDTIPTDVIVGIGSNETYGIDMTEFDDDGYILRSFGNDTLVFGASAEGLDRAVRAYAKAADAGAAETLDETYHEGPRIKRLTIADRDISEYTVVYYHDRDVKNIDTDSPTFGNTGYAAEELVRLIEQATGVTLSIKRNTEVVKGPVIVFDYYYGDDLGENGFTYKVENGNLYINGVGRANGCANAVYYLLQHECGWDALLFGDSDLQPSDHVNIPEGVSKKIKPMFDYNYMRHMFYDDFDTDKSEFSHTYRGSTPQATHALGTWAGKPGQNPCLSDEGVYLNIYDNVLAYIEAQVAAGKVIGEDFLSINLGMEDSATFCNCNDCSIAFREENKSRAGTQVRLANRLAEDMEAEGYYGMKYSIFAYAGSNVPCKTHAREDVYVTYCTNGHCQNHKLDGSECTMNACKEMLGVLKQYYGWRGDSILNNTHFAEWLKGWNEVCDHVYVYTYMLPANFAQYTNLRFLYDDVRFLYESGMEGFTPEAEYIGLGLNRLRFQLIMDMVWHPEMTREEYNLRMGEHMRREYGDGWTFVESYINLWEQTEANTGCWYAWFLSMGQLINPGSCDTDMYAEYAPQMYSLLEEAMKLCNNAKQESRVKRLMCDVLYRECAYKYFPAYDAEDTETLDYLNGRYGLFVSYMEDHDYKFNVVPSQWWGFGPYGPNQTMGSTNEYLFSDLTDEAWNHWQRHRDALTPEGTTQRPLPDGYEVYVPNK